MVRVALENQSLILENLTKTPKDKIQAENNKAIHALLKNS